MTAAVSRHFAREAAEMKEKMPSPVAPLNDGCVTDGNILQTMLSNLLTNGVALGTLKNITDPSCMALAPADMKEQASAESELDVSGGASSSAAAATQPSSSVWKVELVVGLDGSQAAIAQPGVLDISGVQPIASPFQPLAEWTVDSLFNSSSSSSASSSSSSPAANDASGSDTGNGGMSAFEQLQARSSQAPSEYSNDNAQVQVVTVDNSYPIANAPDYSDNNYGAPADFSNAYQQQQMDFASGVPMAASFNVPDLAQGVSQSVELGQGAGVDLASQLATVWTSDYIAQQYAASYPAAVTSTEYTTTTTEPTQTCTTNTTPGGDGDGGN